MKNSTLASAWNALIASAIVGISSPSVQAQPCPDWRRVNLLPRSNHAMAFDRARGVAVMVGGDTATWEWDGSAWSRRAVLSPTGSPALAFDEERNVTVFFGGGKTWEFDGQAWTLKSSTGPVSREDHMLVYDSLRHVTVLFGGSTWQSGTQYLADTWTWDGTQWTEHPVAGPSARGDYAMAFDEARGVVTLFGGHSSSPTMIFGDTWTWDGSAWTQLEVAGPRQRYRHAMAYHAGRQRIVLQGGFFGGYDSSTWEWDGSAWHFVAGVGPTSRADHAMVYDAARHQVVLFGGDDGEQLKGDTWALDIRGEWSMSDAANAPLSRSFPAMAYDTQRQRCVLFGGELDYASYAWSNETWEYDGNTWNQKAIAGPSPRERLAMAYDSNRGVVVLFGGARWDTYHDTWEYDGTTWTLRTNSGPPAMDSPAMAFDSWRNVCVLVGNGGTFEWDGAEWTNPHVGAPGSRIGAALAFDAARGVTVLHGGFAGQYLWDTWEWNGTAWTFRTFAGPGPREYGTMVFDTVRQRVILYGGFVGGAGGNYFGDTWEWDGVAGTWNLLVPETDGPGSNFGHAMVFDIARQRSVMFAGDRTHELNTNAPPVFAQHPVSATAFVGGAATFSIAAQGPEPLNYEWFKEDELLIDGFGVSGANTAALSLTDISQTSAGDYRAVAFNACGEVTSQPAELTVLMMGDTDGDFAVDTDDLLTIITQWGATGSPGANPADIAPPPNGNGVVDIDDLLLVISNWS